MSLTETERAVLRQMFIPGSSIGKTGRDRYTVWDRRRSPVKRFRVSAFLKVKKFCRADRDGRLVLDLRRVRAARKNSWVKQYYLTEKNTND